MDRYPFLVRSYIFVTFVSLILIIVDIDIASLIMSIGYFGTLLYFLFRTETIPTTYTTVPAVDFYNRDRFNKFNYALLSYAVLSALLFALITLNTSIPFGIIPLISWGGLIGFIQWYKKRFPEDLQVKNYILDYVSQELLKQNVNIQRELLNQIILYLQANEESSAIQLAKSNNIPDEVFSKIKVLFEAYINAINEDLSLSEINELN